MKPRPCRHLSSSTAKAASAGSTPAADGWTAEYCLPLDFFRLFYPDFRLIPGIHFRGNCYKCGDRTEHPHFLAWNPVHTPTPDFHRPEFLGEMILS